jgi:hypothetical protein
MSVILNKVSSSAHTVTINGNIFFFSYETIIAVQTPTLSVRENNRWSLTTGKHFSKLGCKYFTIVTEGEFAKILEDIG